MIKCERGSVDIKGKTAEILAEFSCIVQGMNDILSKKNGKEVARDLLDRSYNDGFAEEKEIVGKLLDSIIEALEKFCDSKETEDGE